MVSEKKGVSNVTEDICSSLTKLLDNKKARKKLGISGQGWVKNNIDIKVGLDTYISVYNSLIDKKMQNTIGIIHAIFGLIIVIVGRFKSNLMAKYLSLKLNNF